MLFSNKKIQKAIGQSEAQDKTAKSIGQHLISWQTKWAAWMQEKTERFSGKAKFRVLILFCLLAGGYSIYIATSSLSGKHPLALSISSIKQPKYIQQSGNESTRASASISKEEYQKVQQFRKYMDSLALSPAGKIVHYRILAERPGLMDSIMLLENMYHLQTKK